MCDFKSDYDNSQTFLTIWRLWLTNNVKTAYINGVYELNQISYVRLLKMTQHTTFVYVISWNSDKIVDSIYVMCWTALIAESIEKRCQDFYMKVSLSSLIENYNCLLFDHNILIWTKLYFFFFLWSRFKPWTLHILSIVSKLCFKTIEMFTWTFSWYNLFKC